MRHFLTVAVGLIFLSACSSEPKNGAPAWTQAPSRTIDNGYIVYVGVGHDRSSDRSQFKAEGQALEDLANECSFIPKGARVEDRFTTQEKYESTTYVKIGLELQLCDQAQHSVKPEEVRNLASQNFTEQLKRYQDLLETGELPAGAELAEDGSSELTPPPEPSAGADDTTHILVVRQYVAYQKEIVILSPPERFAPDAPATRTYLNNVQPAAQRISAVQIKNPAVRNQTWSSLPHRPELTKPKVLRPKSPATWKPMRQPPRERAAPLGRGRRGKPMPAGHGRRRRWNPENGN